MVIPGNLPSQLCVMDSSQWLRALLFLAPSFSSTNTLSLKNSQRLSSLFLLKNLFFLSSTFPSFHFLLISPYSSVSKHGLPNHFPSVPLQRCPLKRSLQQPPFFLQHSFYSHLFSLHLRPLTACRTPFQNVPPRVKVLLQLQKARLIPYDH